MVTVVLVLIKMAASYGIKTVNIIFDLGLSLKQVCRFIKSFLYLFLVSANKDQPSPTTNLEIWNLKAARLVAGFSQKKKDTWLVLFQSGLYFICFAIRQKAFEYSRFC